MQRATVILLALCVSILPATGAAATVACAETGGNAAVQNGCCCGGDSQCAMPGETDSLNDACCTTTGHGPVTDAPPPVTTVVVQVELAPLCGTFTAISPAAVPRPEALVGNNIPEHPPHYTLFCSLLN